MSRILIVDDNADNRYSLRLQLSKHETLEAAGGAEAIELARSKRPDCILLDVHMPEMDGFEVCRRLRGFDETRAIPIIFVTAHHRDTDSVVRGLAAGGDEYITKPVAQQELQARVGAMLRIRELQDRLEVLNRDLEHQVWRRTEELRQIYETVPVGIYTLDNRGRVTSFNRHLEELLGYGAEEVVGRLTIGDLFGPDYDAVYWLELCHREGACACEAAARRKDGELVPVYDERVVLLDQAGEPVGYTGYIQDLSRQRRVREILAEQEKQAGVGQLASGIVHEVANPVHGVMQYLDAMLKQLERGERLDAKDVGRGIQVMRDALQRTTDLLKNLRSVTRTAIRPAADVDLLGILRDLQTLMRHDLQSRGVRMHLAGEPPTVRGDAGRLCQVFVNLITNARDSMPHGGDLHVDIRAQDSSVELRFRDTGTGIPPEDLARVFEFLFTTKGEEGTGYGLAISKDIVEEHGGTLSVQSEVGKGSMFVVRLPFGTPIAPDRV